MKKTTLLYILIGIVLAITFQNCKPHTAGHLNPSIAKVALREVGNTLLMANDDSISRVLEVEEVSPTTYSISFENSLEIDPDTLSSAMQKSIEKLSLPSKYLVETEPCNEEVIAHSFLVSPKKEETIIPCKGRVLPNDCYTIKVTFYTSPAYYTNEPLFYVLVGLVIFFLVFVFASRFYTRHSHSHDGESITIGSLYFYPEQHRLVTKAQEIALSKKESELLSILAQSPNTVVTREELTKRVWEDHGVIVGRSLDTYISKLRKKLSADPKLQITNVHGVGYKLEEV